MIRHGRTLASFSLNTSHTDWDVVVVGAGPAGGLASYLLAKKSLRVLLVDKSEFPRDKVCGGCLNVRSLDILRRAGLSSLCDQLGAATIQRMRLCHHRIVADVPLRGTRAVTRRAFDAGLVDRAVTAGAQFRPSTTATVVPNAGGRAASGRRNVELVGPDRSVQHVSAKLILVADGLGHPSLSRLPEFESVIAPRSLIGLGAVANSSDVVPAEGAITMAIGRHGYVGVVSAERGRVNIAAAIDANSVRQRGVVDAVRDVLAEAGGPDLDIARLSWRGTRPMTRTAARVAAERILLLGDSVGYIEPFTGEGMTWALASATAAAEMAVQACDTWQPWLAVDWQRYHDRIRRRDQRVCRAVSRLLKKPFIARSAIGLLSWWPNLASPIVNRLNRGHRQPEILH